MVILSTTDEEFLDMNADNIVISLDDAFDYYEMSKRTVTDKPLYCYDLAKRIFTENKEKNGAHSVPFINSYAVCLNLIDEYLSQPSKSMYRSSFLKESEHQKNKIVSFLWFFEHIDGCEDFKNYEIRSMLKVLKKWCKVNGFGYTEPQVYVSDDN